MMWDKSEKHLALALLFTIVAQPLTGFAGFFIGTIAFVHAGISFYYTFKEGK